MTQCNCMLTHPVGAFSDYADVRALEAHLLSDRKWEEVPVEMPYANVGERERWFRCMDCGQVWRLVYPDSAFEGVWELVT